MGFDLSMAGLAPTPQPTPALGFANDMASQQAQNQYRQAATASTVQDMQQKQRSMQLSMLSGILSEPDPAKQSVLASRLIPVANKLNPSFQIDPNASPDTLRALVMSQVPPEQLPMYQMNAAKAQWYHHMANPGEMQPPGSSPATDMQPSPGAATAAAPAAPSVSPLLSDPFAAVIEPQAVQASAAAQKTLYDSPEGKGRAAEAEALGKQHAEASKGALESAEGYNQIYQTLEALKTMATNPELPQDRHGIPADKQAWFSQNFGDQKGANAYKTFGTINESQTINAIRDLAATGQIKMTRTLENIINKGYLIDPGASPETKVQQANAIETELRNSALAAQNVSAKMSGGGPQAPYTSPLTAPPGAPPQGAAGQADAALQKKQQPGTALPPQGARKAPDGNWYIPDPNRPGKYLQWRP